MNYKDIFQSRSWSGIILVLGILLVVLLVFQAGIFVGYRSAMFSNGRASSYQVGMGDPRSILAPFIHDADDPNPHGTVGEIVSIQMPFLMIKGAQNAEEIVAVSGTTTVRNMRDTASTSMLRVGDQVIVIGAPDEGGQMHAAFIRIITPRFAPAATTSAAQRMPPPPSAY